MIQIVTKALVWIILRIHDVWIWLCNCAYEINLMWIISGLEPETFSTPRLLAAYEDNTDFTAIARAYYATDKTLSCYSLQKWIKICGHQVHRITFVIQRESKIWVAKFDLDKDTELNTDTESSDIDLRTMPGKVVWGYDGR
jgi:hypothetical protein